MMLITDSEIREVMQLYDIPLKVQEQFENYTKGDLWEWLKENARTYRLHLNDMKKK